MNIHKRQNTNRKKQNQIRKQIPKQTKIDLCNFELDSNLKG